VGVRVIVRARVKVQVWISKMHRYLHQIPCRAKRFGLREFLGGVRVWVRFRVQVWGWVRVRVRVRFRVRDRVQVRVRVWVWDWV